MSRIAHYDTPEIARPVDYRQLVLDRARSYIGTTDPAEFFAEAAPMFVTTHGVSWCQIFLLAVLRWLGLTDWLWVPRRGFLWRLPQTLNPLPADIEYLANSKAGKPVQHGCFYAGATPDGMLVSIDGNTSAGVAEKVRAARWYDPPPVFFSVQRLVDARVAEDARIKSLSK